jgi:hypothetical protein
VSGRADKPLAADRFRTRRAPRHPPHPELLPAGGVDPWQTVLGGCCWSGESPPAPAAAPSRPPGSPENKGICGLLRRPSFRFLLLPVALSPRLFDAVLIFLVIALFPGKSLFPIFSVPTPFLGTGLFPIFFAPLLVIGTTFRPVRPLPHLMVGAALLPLLRAERLFAHWTFPVPAAWDYPDERRDQVQGGLAPSSGRAVAEKSPAEAGSRAKSRLRHWRRRSATLS